GCAPRYKTPKLPAECRVDFPISPQTGKDRWRWSRKLESPLDFIFEVLQHSGHGDNDGDAILANDPNNPGSMDFRCKCRSAAKEHRHENTETLAETVTESQQIQ